MNEPRLISLNAVLSGVLWTAVFAAIGGSWILVATGHPSAAIALGFTACVPCSIAIVVTIRSYVLRMCDMIRSLHGIEPPTAVDSGPDLGNVHQL